MTATVDPMSPEDEGYDHLGRAFVRRVRLGEPLREMALLNGRAIDEVEPDESGGDESLPVQRHRGSNARHQDA